MRIVKRKANEEPVEHYGYLTPALGACCKCEAVGYQVRNFIMLPRRAPMPGRGWGCVSCEIPGIGAVAVLCDACVRTLNGKAPPMVCRGHPAEDGRIPYTELGPELVEHDMSRHTEG